MIMMSIVELKKKYGNAAKEIIIGGYGLESKNSHYRCINSIAHKNSDKNFSMSWDSNKNQFYCFACGRILDIYNYLVEIQGLTPYEIFHSHDINISKNITNDKPKQDKIDFKFIPEPITKKQIDYLSSRKINLSTINHFPVTSYNFRIAFIYYINNEISGVKLRYAGSIEKTKRFSAIPGSKYSLWNMKDFKDKTYIIVCEGEIDCMTIYQCGYENVISVPCGANSLNTYIDQYRSYLNQFKNIIIFSDNDESGLNMDIIFWMNFENSKKINKVKMVNKDVNSEYIGFGKDKIQSLVNKCF